eukprot:4170554-Prymnesium_polylepis.1
MVREMSGAGFRDCAACGEPAWGGRLCGAGGRNCANAEVWSGGVKSRRGRQRWLARSARRNGGSIAQ